MSFKRSLSSIVEKSLSAEEQQEKVKKLLCDFCEKLQEMCSEASVSRYLRARNRNVKKAPKMLRESMKWRLQSRPEKILWEDVSAEAEMGKVYKANFLDKLGSTLLVMRPGFQNRDVRLSRLQNHNVLVRSKQDRYKIVPPFRDRLRSPTR